MDGASPQSERVGEFMELFARHYGHLFRYVRSLLFTNNDTDDVMQEVSQVLWKDFAKFQSGTNFAAWARRIAYHRVLEFRRAAERKPELLPDDVLEQLADEAETMWTWADDHREALDTCLNKLRSKDRELISLKYNSNMRVTAMADKLRRPVHSLYQTLSRIRRSLLECIQRQMACAQQPANIES